MGCCVMVEDLLPALTRAEKAQLSPGRENLDDTFPGVESSGIFALAKPCIVRTRIPSG